MRTMAGVFLIFGACCEAFGQSAPPPRAFEVASVKPHPGLVPRIDISTSGTRLTAEAQTVLGLIMYAYNLRNDQVSRTTPLLTLDDTMYDVVANAEGEGTPTKGEFRQMMQSLLADRFKLSVHRERKELPVYALVVGKSGPKLKESAPDADPQTHTGISGRNNVETMPKATMESLVQEISNAAFLDRPVLDKTGLTGAYNIKLTYTPENRISRGPEPDLDVSIFTVVQDQLGLRLVQQKAEVEILVVDRVEKPSAN
jgi:uncharacterized protein (TIGR03435 family)